MATEARLLLEGEYWTVSFGGREVRVRDSTGMGFLAQLLSQPGTELPALALAGAGSGAMSAGEAADAGLSFAGDSDAGPLLDADAKSAYRQRLDELREEIGEAERFRDPERAARARDEFAAIAEELSAATGLGGRDRRAGSVQERARLNVSRAIARAITRLGDLDGELGEHLSACVQTGRVCVYRPPPDGAVRWAAGPATAEPATPAALQLPLPAALSQEAGRGFVGREEQLGWLRERLDRARGGW